VGLTEAEYAISIGFNYQDIYLMWKATVRALHIMEHNYQNIFFN